MKNPHKLRTPCPRCGIDLNGTGLITEDKIYDFKDDSKLINCPYCQTQLFVYWDWVRSFDGGEMSVLDVEIADWQGKK